MKGDTENALAAGAHALVFPHGLGHMMGLDVHDMESLGEDHVGYAGEPRSTQFGLKSLRLARPLEPGFVFTIEPGIYFIPQLIADWMSRALRRLHRVRRARTMEGLRRRTERGGLSRHAIRRTPPRAAQAADGGGDRGRARGLTADRSARLAEGFNVRQILQPPDGPLVRDQCTPKGRPAVHVPFQPDRRTRNACMLARRRSRCQPARSADNMIGVSFVASAGMASASMAPAS